jgi:hypothetical protein
MLMLNQDLYKPSWSSWVTVSFEAYLPGFSLALLLIYNFRNPISSNQLFFPRMALFDGFQCKLFYIFYRVNWQFSQFQLLFCILSTERIHICHENYVHQQKYLGMAILCRIIENRLCRQMGFISGLIPSSFIVFLHQQYVLQEVTFLSYYNTDL